MSEGGVGAGGMVGRAGTAGAQVWQPLRSSREQLCGSRESGGRTKRKQRKTIRERQGRRLQRKKIKGIEQLGF